MHSSTLIFQHASKDLGLKEVDGPASHPRIKQAIQFAADWLDKDDSKTAWCGCIRGLWGNETQTGTPSAYYRAKNWLNWGRRIANIALAKQGDTVVLYRKGGFHVGLFHSWDGVSEIFKLLSGNQSNSCSVATFKISDIEGIRRSNLDV